MKKHFFILMILAITTLLFSCATYDKPNGSFIISGTLLYRTDSTPVIGHPITVLLLLEKGGFSYENKIVEVGNGKSDSSGTFKVLCDYYESGINYEFKEKDIPNNGGINPRKTGDTVDIGTSYIY